MNISNNPLAALRFHMRGAMARTEAAPSPVVEVTAATPELECQHAQLRFVPGKGAECAACAADLSDWG